MAKKEETKFKEKVLKDLRLLPNSWWEKIAQTSIRGTPDILGCLSSKFVAIELKVEHDLDLLQEIKLSKIEKAGGYAFIAYPGNWDTIYSKLRKISQL